MDRKVDEVIDGISQYLTDEGIEHNNQEPGRQRSLNIPIGHESYITIFRSMERSQPIVIVVKEYGEWLSRVFVDPADPQCLDKVMQAIKSGATPRC